MAGYYAPTGTNISAAQMNIGDITKAGASIGEALNSVRQREIDNVKLAREADRYAREQEMNKRQDIEYNREVGLRDNRKALSAEFLANPYANKFGGGKESEYLDKQVIDYVNSGGEINEDLAKRLQSRYEDVRPFREDASNSLTSLLVSMGEDPTKAAQTGTALGSNLLSRVEQQARVDANRKVQQEYYDKQADLGLKTAELNQKAQLNADDNAAKFMLAKFNMYGGSGGGGSGGGSGGMTYDDIKFGKKGDELSLSPAWDFLGIPLSYDADKRKLQDYADKASAEKIPARVFYNAVANSTIGNTDKTVDYDKVKSYLETYGKTGDATSGGRTAPSYSAEQFTPNYAQRQIVGYDPKQFLEDSRATLPELFGGKAKGSTQLEQSLTGGSGSTSQDGKKVFTLSDGNQIVRDTSIPLTEQLNNPGAIKQASRRDANVKWLGEVGKDDQGHTIFDTPEHGARAQIVNMQTQIGKGTTLQDMVSTYATGNQKEYADRISKETGIKITDVLTKDQALPLVKAMSKVEAGGKATGKYNEGLYDNVYKTMVSKNTLDAGGWNGLSREDKFKKIDKSKELANDESIDWSTGTSMTEDKETVDKFNKTIEGSGISTTTLKKELPTDALTKKIADSYLKNNGGFLDDNVAIVDIMRTRGVNRKQAEAEYEKITNYLDKTRDGGKNITNYTGDIPYSETEEYKKNNPMPDASNYLRAALGTANSISADTLQVATSPYTTMRYGLDTLFEKAGLPVNHKKTYFDAAADKATNTALTELSKVTDHPEAVLNTAKLVTPFGANKLMTPIKESMGLANSMLSLGKTKPPTSLTDILSTVSKNKKVESATDKLLAKKRSEAMQQEAADWERIALQKERQASTNTPEEIRQAVAASKEAYKAEAPTIRLVKETLEGIGGKGVLSFKEEEVILNSLEKLQKMSSKSTIEILREMNLSPKVEKYIMTTLRQTR